MHPFVHGLPNICGNDAAVADAAARTDPVYGRDPHRLDGVRAGYALALHMHQPTIPAGGRHLSSAGLINNLQFLYEHPEVPDSHNAGGFENCYNRIADLVRELAGAGKHPRIMLDYSGNLLWGLAQMGKWYVIDNLRDVTNNPRTSRCVEWLGTMWSHAVVPSTPVPDVRLHIRAWQHHFASLFGLHALSRVKGFSPPEMHLPNHPDAAFEYVRALRDCGYRYLLVQEHSVETPEGDGIRSKGLEHLPCRLVCRNSSGETASITALIKTQGSDTKLVAQVQPLHEARTLQRREVAGKSIPPLVTQIGDGENGGVMMNEFPNGYRQAIHTQNHEVHAFNGLEYLEAVEAAGLSEDDFPAIQPINQAKLFETFDGGGPAKLAEAIAALRKNDPRFSVDGGSWTNDRSWVSGYEGVLDPMNKLSAHFHNTLDGRTDVDRNGHAYRNALLHLLLAETSCFRYWGGNHIFVEYAKELCRRGNAILDHDFPKR